MNFESKWIRAGDFNTHYLVGGQGPPLVLIHGAGARTGDQEWKANLGVLAGHYQVYIPEMVGFGNSDKPRIDYTIPLFSEFFSNFISALELRSPSLLGHSLGGGIALDFTLRYPGNVSKLILVDTAGLSEELGFLGKLLFPVFTTIARLRGDHVFVSLMTGGNGGEPVKTFMDRLHEIEVPTLILWGGWDGYLPVRLAHEAHQRMPNCRLHVFPRCWHAPQKQRADEFNRHVLEFLAE